MKRAFLFPGQGSQFVGMGKDFSDGYPLAKKTFEEADDLLKMHLSKVTFGGPESELLETKNAQVSVFTFSIAVLRVLEQEYGLGIQPSFCSGLSLGEYSALVGSGKLSFQKALYLIQERGRLMNEACNQHPGTMAAVLGLNGERVDQVISEIKGLYVANYNCPGQVVISGTLEGVEKGALALKEEGAKRVIPLNVSGAFHTPLMKPAQDALAPLLRETSFLETPVELVMNVVGTSSNMIQENLISHVTGAVRWEQGIQFMDQRGVELYLEIGCGKTLTGMNRKIGVKGKTLNVEKVSDIKILGDYLCS